MLLKLPKLALEVFKSAWLAFVPTVVLKFPKSVVNVARPVFTVLLKLPRFVLVVFNPVVKVDKPVFTVLLKLPRSVATCWVAAAARLALLATVLLKLPRFALVVFKSV